MPEIDDQKKRDYFLKLPDNIPLDEEKEKLLVLAIIHAARDMGNIKPPLRVAEMRSQVPKIRYVNLDKYTIEIKITPSA